MSKYNNNEAKLYNWYATQLNCLHKNNVSNSAGLLDYFVASLKLLRDRTLLADGVETDGKLNTKLVALANVVAEYELYETCAFKYYKIENNTPVRLDTDKTTEEVQKEFSAEKAEHWLNFWRLVALNIEEWSNENTVQQNNHP